VFQCDSTQAAARQQKLPPLPLHPSTPLCLSSHFSSMTKPKHFCSAECKPQKINDEVEACLQEAKKALLVSTDPKYTAKKAAKQFDVPYNTLRNRLKGMEPRKVAHEKEMLLTEGEKKVVVDWIRFLGLARVPVCKCTIWPKVKAIMWAKGLAVTENSVPSTWI
jgi:helix-turn-helix, Psq domain